ncbi:MAG: hypothetical protein WCI72_03600 [archaeon]
MEFTLIGAGALLVIGILLIIFGSLGKLFKWIGIIITLLSAGYLIFNYFF